MSRRDFEEGDMVRYTEPATPTMPTGLGDFILADILTGPLSGQRRPLRRDYMEPAVVSPDPSDTHVVHAGTYRTGPVVVPSKG